MIEGDSLGKKTIGTLGSWVLLINNITGPGLVILPVAFQVSGWIPCLLLLGIMGAMSIVCCSFITESMTKIPGNENFQGRVEFLYLTRNFFNDIGYKIVLFLFITSLVTTNVSSIVESGQSLDKAMLQMGTSCALEFYPDFGFKCIHSEDSNEDSVFGDAYVLSVGYLVILVIAIPLGYMNLDDNIVVQIVSCIGLVVICTVWFVYMCFEGLDLDRIPAATSSSDAFGYVCFNFAYIITIPSWINEKKPDVNAKSAMVWTNIIGVLAFVLSGFLGAMAFHFDNGADMLSVLTELDKALYVRIFTFLFPLFTLVSSIPVFSIIMRYNLLENKICSTPVANFWSVIFPWVLSLFFYGGNAINYILLWTGLATVYPLNFMVPAYLHIITNRRGELSNNLLETKSEQLSTVPEEDAVTDMLVSGGVSSVQKSSFSPRRYEALPGWRMERQIALAYFIIVASAIATVYSVATTLQSEITGG